MNRILKLIAGAALIAGASVASARDRLSIEVVVTPPYTHYYPVYQTAPAVRYVQPYAFHSYAPVYRWAPTWQQRRAWLREQERRDWERREWRRHQILRDGRVHR